MGQRRQRSAGAVPRNYLAGDSRAGLSLRDRVRSGLPDPPGEPAGGGRVPTLLMTAPRTTSVRARPQGRTGRRRPGGRSAAGRAIVVYPRRS